jgi:hypothetical protein
MASFAEVEQFLARARELIRAEDALVVKRPKNQATLEKLGMTTKAVLQDVSQFSACEYCKGPEVDRDRAAQDCWFFGTEVMGTKVYVKLAIQELSGGRERLAVISYHEAERPMYFPFN